MSSLRPLKEEGGKELFLPSHGRGEGKGGTDGHAGREENGREGGREEALVMNLCVDSGHRLLPLSPPSILLVSLF